jgi:multiple sugar transport system substrate-binding protein
MPKLELNVAFIAGPMYDSLYAALPDFTQATGIQVSIGFHGVHPNLNAHLTSLRQAPYDLVSTHTKYASSQQHLLSALPEEDRADFFPTLLDMARIDGVLYGLPRNIDVKLLHYRRDKLPSVPQTWDELVEVSRRLSHDGQYGFVFTGKDSGLFGMFYELAEMGGAHLFPSSNVPQLNNEGGRWALQTIRNLYVSAAVPPAIVDWQFDEAHQCFRDGAAAMICDWPGYYASYSSDSSEVKGKFGLARMPAGPGNTHKAYAGAHTFALTSRGAPKPEAHQLLHFLTCPQQQLAEAERGSVPVRRSVMDKIRGHNSERWELLEQVIATDTLIPPRLPYYPEIEEILWRTVQSAMIGELSLESALINMENRIVECHIQNAAARR